MTRKTSFAGWDNCLEITSGDLKLYVTLDIGPRIIGLFHKDREENLFFVKPETSGKTDLATYSSYGGHRLLIGPELYGHQNEPDNNPVLESPDGWISTQISPLGWQKSLRVTPQNSGFSIENRVTNIQASPKEICPWTLTVVRSSGTSFTPSQPFVAHPTGIEAASSLVLWPYTDLSDPRYKFSPHGIALRCEDNPELTATKYGLTVPQQVAGYLTDDGFLFTKRWETASAPSLKNTQDWPDRGVNYEAFTRTKMLELESLGPLVTLNPGETTEITEHWTLEPEAKTWQEIAQKWR